MVKDISNTIERENTPTSKNKLAVYAMAVGISLASVFSSGCGTFNEYIKFQNDPDHPCKTGAAQNAKYSHPASAKCEGLRQADAYQKGRDYNTGRRLEYK